MMKLLSLIFFIAVLVSCKPAEEKKSSPFTFNREGGAPILPTLATGMTRTSPAGASDYISTATFQLTGVVEGETVKLYIDSTCSTEVGSVLASGTTVNITTSVLPVRAMSFYTKSINKFTATACSASMAVYEYLGIRPTTATSMTLTNPSSSPGVIATPTLLLGGVVSGETIKVYIDNTCSDMYGSAVASGTSVSITLRQLAPATHSLYTNTTNAYGTSTCSSSMLTYQYTGVAPVTITTLTRSDPTSSSDYDATPTFLATGSSNGDTVKLYTDSGCTTQVGSVLATTSTALITTSALAVGTYNFYSKTTNVIGTSTCSALLISYSYLGVAPSVAVTWTANREKAVNSTGGGYRIYYSKTSGFDVTTASYVDVPYVSGGSAPVTKTFSNLTVGNTYFKIVAYSALNAPGSTAGSQSSASTQFSVSLP